MKDTSENWKNTWNNSFQTLDNRAAQDRDLRDGNTHGDPVIAGDYLIFLLIWEEKNPRRAQSLAELRGQSSALRKAEMTVICGTGYWREGESSLDMWDIH